MYNRRAFLGLLAASLVIASRGAFAGAWSHESFGNDGALDWVAEFVEQPTYEFLRTTMLAGTSGKYIDSFAGESIIAAAEVVAASLGAPCKDLPPEILAFVASRGTEYRKLRSLANSAIAGILGSSSELRENWSANREALARWEGAVNELLGRLSHGKV
jgi:hypothetical protein